MTIPKDENDNFVKCSMYDIDSAIKTGNLNVILNVFQHVTSTNIYDLPTIFDEHDDWVWSADFDPDGSRFVTGSKDGIIRVFDVLQHKYADRICGLVRHNMSNTQWRQYVGDPNEIEYEYTCEGLEKSPEDQ